MLLKFCLSVPTRKTLPCLQCCELPLAACVLYFLIQSSLSIFRVISFAFCQGSLLSSTLLLTFLLNSHPFCWNSSSPLLAGKWKVTVSLSPSNVMILCSFVCSPGCFHVFPVGELPLFCYTEAASAQFQRQSAKPHFSSALSLTQLPLWGDNMFQSSSHPFLLVVSNFPTKMQSFQWFCLLRNKILLPK